MKKFKGDLGESLIVADLRRRGFRILARNWRSHQVGEIDIICRRQKILVFVEVKTRVDDKFGSGLSAVDENKLSRLWATAEDFLLANPGLGNLPCRLDVAEVWLDFARRRAQLKWYRGIA